MKQITKAIREKLIENHKKLGLLSPCSRRWGEFQLLKGKNKTKYLFIYIFSKSTTFSTWYVWGNMSIACVIFKL